ncbi:MAG: hypothetical protein KDK27_17755, partial [Leptospiraceae bacterium]|nr:hypothetical protein [Leptospiraceae bacterium]
HMETRSEDYLLYRRDLEQLTGRNALFVERAADFEDELDFDYDSVSAIDDLKGLVDSLDDKYDAHRRELHAIINQERDGALDEAGKLAAIKTDIAQWLSDSQDEDARLRREVISYFQDGLGGFYLTENENDPYLMTRAEYEWELLRRERNYMAKRLERAEAVKRYAELARDHAAGIEMASITAERAEISKLRSDLSEVGYLLIKGDLDLHPDAATDATVRDAEFARILAERNQDVSFLDDREAALNAELAMLADITAESAPDVADLDGWIAALDTFLNDFVSGDADTTDEEARAAHRMNAVRSKLLEYRTQMADGGDALTLNQRWVSLSAGFGVLQNELIDLSAEYNFDNFRTDVDALRLSFGEKAIPAYQSDLDALRDGLEAKAQELADARVRLEEAKQKYRDARIDFDILNSANPEELIRFDLLNTTKQLAGVLNRMAEIEDMEGMADRLTDIVGKQEANYLHDVMQSQRATDDLAYTEETLKDVQDLEAAKLRLAALEDLISANNINALATGDVSELADLFINNKADLVDADAPEEERRSFIIIRTAFDQLSEARQEWSDANDALNAALA